MPCRVAELVQGRNLPVLMCFIIVACSYLLEGVVWERSRVSLVCQREGPSNFISGHAQYFLLSPAHYITHTHYSCRHGEKLSRFRVVLSSNKMFTPTPIQVMLLYCLIHFEVVKLHNSFTPPFNLCSNEAFQTGVGLQVHSLP